jgi:anti-sigma regulatory factor (Ser/Thr protein kinase)
VRELSLHILDAIQNAVEAGATRVEVSIVEDLEVDRMTIEIIDNGRGMDAEILKQVKDPFYTTRDTRHVGLGIPLFLAAARQCEGDLSLESEPGKGTRLRVTFRHSHIDRAPLGDMAETLFAILLSEHPVDINYTHRVGTQEFQFDSSEIREELGPIPLGHPKVRNWLMDFLREGESALSPKEKKDVNKLWKGRPGDMDR